MPIHRALKAYKAGHYYSSVYIKFYVARSMHRQMKCEISVPETTGKGKTSKISGSSPAIIAVCILTANAMKSIQLYSK